MRAPKQQGFILVTTVWLLAFVALAAGFFSLWVHDTMEAARNNRYSLNDELDMRGTEAVLTYLLTTQGLSYTGVKARPPGVQAFDDDLLSSVEELLSPLLFIDDTVYRGLGDIRFSIQDEAGLVALNYTGAPHLDRLLGLLGVAYEERAGLISKLEDYSDYDELQRLNGAEADSYKSRGLTPPPNRPLKSQWEAWNVLEWRAHSGLWQDQALPLYTNAVWKAWPNFNTAPETVLLTWDGIDSVAAEKIIEARRERPITSLSALNALLGKHLELDPLEFSFFPSKYLRLSLWSEKGRRMKEVHLKYTPLVPDSRPWEVQYVVNGLLTDARSEALPIDVGISEIASAK